MRVRLTDPITGKFRTQRAYLTTEHPASHYGQPVLIVCGNILDYANAVMQHIRTVEPPKRPDQVRMMRQWIKNFYAAIGCEEA